MPGEYASNDEILARLRAVVERCDSQKAAAAQLGVSSSLLSQVLRSWRTPGPKLTRAIGFDVKRHRHFWKDGMFNG
jgi:hypothetical protein